MLESVMRPLLVAPIFALSLISCAADGPTFGDDDIVGPFTGPVRRYAIDVVVLPTTSQAVLALATDFDGDTSGDNVLGQSLTLLAQGDNLSQSGIEMLRSGRIETWIEIQADALDADAAVGVRYFGSADDDPTEMGGAFVDGAFLSNRSATTAHPGRSTVDLPVFVDAGPSTFELRAVELELTPDGVGGFNGIVRGAVPVEQVTAACVAGLSEMLANNPQGHRPMASLFDANDDGVVTAAEIESNTLVQAITSADLDLYDGDAFTGSAGGDGEFESLSFAYQLHLVPCDDGGCQAAPIDTCVDGILDGDETDVDCGGTCRPCAADAACTAPTDCQAGTCTDDACDATTCTDGVQNAYEGDVDCGFGCGPCAIGDTCYFTTDCGTAECVDGVCA